MLYLHSPQASQMSPIAFRPLSWTHLSQTVLPLTESFCLISRSARFANKLVHSKNPASTITITKHNWRDKRFLKPILQNLTRMEFHPRQNTSVNISIAAHSRIVASTSKKWIPWKFSPSTENWKTQWHSFHHEIVPDRKWQDPVGAENINSDFRLMIAVANLKLATKFMIWLKLCTQRNSNIF